MTPRRRYSIQGAVKEIVLEDRKVLKDMQLPYFNTSAYARQIQKKVERMVGHKVKLNTITVSLKRLQRKVEQLLKEAGASTAEFGIKDLHVKAPVSVLKVFLDKHGRTFISGLVADKRAEESVYTVMMFGEWAYIVVKREFAKELSPTGVDVKALEGEYALLRLIPNQGEVTNTVNAVVTKLNEDGVDVESFSVSGEEVVFVVKYSELIKVLAWFS